MGGPGAAQRGSEPKGRATFNRTTVRQLLYRFGRIGRCLRLTGAEPSLLPDEWWISQLAMKLAMPTSTLTDWIHRGWLQAQKEPGHAGRWICWADAEELERLRRLYASPRGCSIHHPDSPELTTPKPRPRR